MKKCLVVYKSTTGFTRKYARWIAKELDCDIAQFCNASARLMASYDMVIFGSRVHAGTVDTLEKMKIKVSNARVKHFVVFATGITPTDDKDAISAVWQNSFTKEQLRKIPRFYFPGGFDKKGLSLWDKFMIKRFTSALNKIQNRTESQQKVLDCLNGTVDFTDIEYIKPLIGIVNSKLKLNTKNKK